MITGQVNASLEAVISLTVCRVEDANRQVELTVEAVIDTGYSAYLTLPTRMIAELDLSPIGDQQLILADGSKVDSTLYSATVIWDGQERAIEVDALEEEVLVGMALMDGYDLSVRVMVGGTVTLKPISPAQ